MKFKQQLYSYTTLVIIIYENLSVLMSALTRKISRINLPSYLKFSLSCKISDQTISKSHFLLPSSKNQPFFIKYSFVCTHFSLRIRSSYTKLLAKFSYSSSNRYWKISFSKISKVDYEISRILSSDESSCAQRMELPFRSGAIFWGQNRIDLRFIMKFPRSH